MKTKKVKYTCLPLLTTAILNGFAPSVFGQNSTPGRNSKSKTHFQNRADSIRSMDKKQYLVDAVRAGVTGGLSTRGVGSYETTFSAQALLFSPDLKKLMADPKTHGQAYKRLEKIKKAGADIDRVIADPNINNSTANLVIKGSLEIVRDVLLLGIGGGANAAMASKIPTGGLAKIAKGMTVKGMAGVVGFALANEGTQRGVKWLFEKGASAADDLTSDWDGITKKLNQTVISGQSLRNEMLPNLEAALNSVLAKDPNDPQRKFLETHLFHEALSIDPDLSTEDLIFSNLELSSLIYTKELVQIFKSLPRDSQGRILFSNEKIEELVSVSGDILKQLRSGEVQRHQVAQRAANEFDVETVRASLGAVAGLVSHFDPKRGQQLKAVFIASIAVTDAFEKFSRSMDGDDLQKLVKGFDLKLSTILTADLIGIALNLVTAFMKTGPTPDELILDGIKQVGNQVREMQSQMHQRFDIVDSKLNQIHLDLHNLFGEISASLVDLKRDTVEIKNELQNIKGKLEELDRKLTQSTQRLEKFSQEILNNLTRKELSSCSVFAAGPKKLILESNRDEAVTCIKQADKFLVESKLLADKSKVLSNDVFEKPHQELAHILASDQISIEKNEVLPTGKLFDSAVPMLVHSTRFHGLHFTYFPSAVDSMNAPIKTDTPLSPLWGNYSRLHERYRDFSTLGFLNPNDQTEAYATTKKNQDLHLGQLSSEVILQRDWEIATKLALNAAISLEKFQDDVPLAELDRLSAFGGEISKFYSFAQGDPVQKTNLIKNTLKYMENSYEAFSESLKRFVVRFSENVNSGSMRLGRKWTEQPQFTGTHRFDVGGNTPSAPDVFDGMMKFCSDDKYVKQIESRETLNEPFWKNREGEGSDFMAVIHQPILDALPREVQVAHKMKLIKLDFCVQNIAFNFQPLEILEDGFPKDFGISYVSLFTTHVPRGPEVAVSRADFPAFVGRFGSTPPDAVHPSLAMDPLDPSKPRAFQPKYFSRVESGPASLDANFDPHGNLGLVLSYTYSAKNDFIVRVSISKGAAKDAIEDLNSNILLQVSDPVVRPRHWLKTTMIPFERPFVGMVKTQGDLDKYLIGGAVGGTAVYPSPISLIPLLFTGDERELYRTDVFGFGFKPGTDFVPSSAPIYSTQKLFDDYNLSTGFTVSQIYNSSFTSEYWVKKYKETQKVIEEKIEQRRNQFSSDILGQISKNQGEVGTLYNQAVFSRELLKTMIQYTFPQSYNYSSDIADFFDNQKNSSQLCSSGVPEPNIFLSPVLDQEKREYLEHRKLNFYDNLVDSLMLTGDDALGRSLERSQLLDCEKRNFSKIPKFLEDYFGTAILNSPEGAVSFEIPSHIENLNKRLADFISKMNEERTGFQRLETALENIRRSIQNFRVENDIDEKKWN